jgi:hypothetical protein
MSEHSDRRHKRVWWTANGWIARHIFVDGTLVSLVDLGPASACFGRFELMVFEKGGVLLDEFTSRFIHERHAKSVFLAVCATISRGKDTPEWVKDPFENGYRLLVNGEREAWVVQEDDSQDFRVLRNGVQVQVPRTVLQGLLENGR